MNDLESAARELLRLDAEAPFWAREAFDGQK